MINFESYFKITYGLYVVSAAYDKKRNGYISNTVFQVTSDPAQLAIACSKNNLSAEIIEKSKAFSVSILMKETCPDIIGTFGYRSGNDIEKFEKFNYKTGKTGSPILLDDTIAWFECEVVSKIDVGTHLIFIGKVVDNDLLEANGDPLSYTYYRDVKKGKAPKNAPTYIDPEKQKAEKQIAGSKKYTCNACGYEYDPMIGDPEHGIPPGTPFEQLPDSWTCPMCGAEKSEFSENK
jgi:flavin reductase (DIM6/NTAB) family NADH-FMN oxidoreductase RutF/rubredoxin